MFTHLFRKVYLVDKNESINIPTYMNLKKLEKEYKQLKTEYPNMYTLYDDWMFRLISHDNTRIQNSHIKKTLFTCNNDNEYLEIIQDYCNYLGLSYKEYMLLCNHSYFCSRYILSEKEKSLMTKQLIIEEKDFIYKDKQIKKGFENFPAEYAINCLDKEWAIKKYEHFRTCEILDKVRKIQIEYYQNSKKLPDLLKQFVTRSVDLEIRIETNSKLKEEILNCLGKIENVDKLWLPIEEYVKTFPTLGYSDVLSFKFNWPLAKHFMETGYRIDSNAK